MMVHQPTPWPAGPSCPQGGALCFSKVVGTDRDGSSVHTCPLGPGCQAMANFWLLVLLDHVHVRRAALPAPPAMEWTSHPLDPICSLNSEDSWKYPHLSHDIRVWLVTVPINFPAPAS